MPHVNHKGGNMTKGTSKLALRWEKEGSTKYPILHRIDHSGIITNNSDQSSDVDSPNYETNDEISHLCTDASASSFLDNIVPPPAFRTERYRQPGAFFVPGLRFNTPAGTNTHDPSGHDAGDIEGQQVTEANPSALPGYLIPQRAKVTPIPSVSDGVVDGKIDEKPQYISKWAGFLLVLGAMLLTGGVVLVSVLFSRESNLQSSSLLPPTSSPTTFPLDPLFIFAPVIENQALLMDTGSSEGKAFYWITHEDPSGLINASGIPEWRLIQRYTLALLYFSTNGPDWTDRIGFLSSTNECDWHARIPFSENDINVALDGRNTTEIVQGLSSCTSDGRLQSIRLLRNNLTNIVPWSALASLPNLRSLDLEGNPGLAGTLPTEFGASIQTLTLAGCGMKGTLPIEWSRLTELRLLALANNEISGTLPSEYYSLTNLEFLGLFNNRLTGTLPPELSSFGSNLQVAIFSKNDLSGTLPPEYGNWTNLEVFSSNENAIYGVLPEAYNSWNSVRWVSLSRNTLLGSLPASYSSWTNLQILSISENLLTGSLPESYGSWTNLQRFDAGYNALSGKLPISYSSWTSLATAGFADNLLSGPLPDGFGAWSDATIFHCQLNLFSGTLPESYRSWKAIRVAAFHRNQLTASLPNSYKTWKNIENFSLFGNQLMGTLPESYSAWTNLKFLSLAENIFSGTLPSSYSSWRNLEGFSLSENDISGSLPASYTSWTKLQSFDGYNNLMTGTLPPEYGSWTGLLSINMHGNKLTGTLPSSYSSWTNVEGIFLQLNQLTGSLPESFGKWTSMEQIFAYRNLLTGTLPTSYASMTSLIDLDLSYNELSGTLPPEYSSWVAIEQFNLFSNMLTGTFPSVYLSFWKSIQGYDLTGNTINGTDLFLLPFYHDDFNLVCNICGAGNVMTLPNSFVNLSSVYPGVGLHPCRIVQRIEPIQYGSVFAFGPSSQNSVWMRSSTNLK